MPTPFALFSLDYPPERGGVARYLGDLVMESDGGLDVFVPETHAITGPGNVQNMRSLATGSVPWRPLIQSLRSLRARGYRALLLSHLLPVGSAAMLAKALGGLPYALIVHGLDLRLAQSTFRKRIIAKRVLRNASAVFTNSQAVAKEVTEFDARLKPIVVTPGLRPRTFLSHQEARARLDVSKETFVCLTVARLVPRKGIDTMIRLLKRLPQNVEYVIVGDGNDRLRLEGLVKEEGVTNVRFLTTCGDEERDAWSAAADVFVFLAREEGIDLEGFGIAPLEASQAGLPVLAGRTGGVGEAVVDGETGVLVDANDLAEARRAFMRLYDDASLRAQLGEAGKMRAERDFSWRDRWQRIRAELETL